MHFGQLGWIDLWSLDDFNFSNLDVFQWINVGNFFSDFLLNNFWGEQVENLSGIRFGNFFSNDFVNFSSDWFLLGALGTIGFWFLVWRLFSSFGVIDNEFDFSPSESVLIWGQIRLHLGDNSSSDCIFDFFKTLSSVCACVSERFRLEWSGCFQFEPLFSRKRINYFLFHSLFTEVFLIFSLSHWMVIIKSLYLLKILN